MNTLLKGCIFLITALIIYGLWYVNRYSMDSISPMEYNSLNAQYSILIASQGSKYKNKLTKKLIDEISETDRFIRVIDVDALSQEERNYDAYIIIHTWEIYKAPASVSEFVSKSKHKKSIYTICTSGSGDGLIEGIDGMSSASLLTDIEMLTENTVLWLDSVLSSN